MYNLITHFLLTRRRPHRLGRDDRRLQRARHTDGAGGGFTTVQQVKKRISFMNFWHIRFYLTTKISLLGNSRRMDSDDSLTISFNEWRDFLLLAPSDNIHDIIKYWRHSTVSLTLTHFAHTYTELGVKLLLRIKSHFWNSPKWSYE